MAAKMKMAVSNRRLLKLAAFLRTLPRKRFDYNTWVGEDWKGAPDLSCGTTACALGWATAMPAFRRLGLYLNDNFLPRLKGKRGDSIKTAMKVFGLTWPEAYDLFLPTGDEINVTPKYVARKIERFVASRV